MNPNKALWEKGDFTRIAETMRERSRAEAGATTLSNFGQLNIGSVNALACQALGARIVK
jgi:hypothetical protein